jgi:RNA polymerase sigma-70 factor (ECF subfamily)
MQSDETLVRAVLSGQRTAYEQLYDRYAPLVRGICYDSTQSLADAQDLAQDVFLRAYEKLHQLRDPACFAKWLVTIARLRCKEWLRRRSRELDRRTTVDDSELAVGNPSSDGQIELLRKTIRQLPDKERLALHVFYLQGNSAESARQIMGLSRPGFYRVLGRARKRLKKLLEKEQGDI